MTQPTLPESWPEGWNAAATLLRSRRETLGMPLDVLAHRTRISHSHLCAMEAARFDRCGAPVYAVGFARAAARALDLADPPVVSAVRAGYAERAPAPVSPALPPRRGIPDLRIAATAALLVSLLSAFRS